MKLTYYHKTLIVAAVGIFFTNLSQYLYYNHEILAIATPKLWVMGFCVLSLPVLLKHTTAAQALKSPVLLWCFGYAVLTILSFLSSSQSELAWQEIRWRFLAIILVLMLLMLLWEPGAVRLARRTLVGAVLFGVALNIYELFVPMSFSTTLGRSAGLYENPNLAGEALVVGMILSVTVLERRYQVPFILLAGIGVFVTLSRASIVAWLIAVTGIVLVEKLRPKDLLVSAFVGLLLVALFLLPRWDQLLTTWERSGVMGGDTVERLVWFTDPLGVSDRSGWERKYVAKRSWEKIEEHPFLGSGTGSYHDMIGMPHNQYLSFMLDHGVIGVMILPLLILAATWGARGQSRGVALVFGCAVLVLSLFTHAILYREQSLILFSLMAAMAGTSRDRQSQRTVAMEMRKEGAPQAVGGALLQKFVKEASMVRNLGSH
jgi:hypothetical protein